MLSAWTQKVECSQAWHDQITEISSQTCRTTDRTHYIHYCTGGELSFCSEPAWWTHLLRPAEEWSTLIWTLKIFADWLLDFENFWQLDLTLWKFLDTLISWLRNFFLLTNWSETLEILFTLISWTFDCLIWHWERYSTGWLGYCSQRVLLSWQVDKTVRTFVFFWLDWGYLSFWPHSETLKKKVSIWNS